MRFPVVLRLIVVLGGVLAAVLATPSAALARCGEVSYQPGGASSSLCPTSVSAAGITAAAGVAAAATAAAAARALVRGAMSRSGLTSAVQAMTGVQAAPGAQRPLLQPHPQHARLPVRVEQSGTRQVRDQQTGRRTGGFNPELLKPQASTVYRVDNRHLFVTDAQARTVNVQSRLQYTRKADAADKRSSGSQTRAGGAWRRAKGGLASYWHKVRWAMGDQGGHWIAASLGGPGEIINMAAMVERLNGNRVRNLYPRNEAWRGRLARYQENYFRQEKRWRDILRANPDTDIVLDIHITYPDAVSQRPSSFTVYVTIDGIPQEPMRFRNDTW